ncbi:MAG: NADP-dependent phosphogluconate dehydrogenase [Patescibacteria group bacterium]
MNIPNDKLNQIALIGLGTMGASLALNIANNGYNIAVFNRTSSKTEHFIKQNNKPNLKGYYDLKDLVGSLAKPRKVILMVPSGSAVEEMIQDLMPLLEADDIILDCGNSNWKDTLNNQQILDSKQIQFIGCGVSGGEEGALKGPSIMPGGNFDSVNSVLPILEKIAALDFNGKPCVSNVGLAAAGHFVKMVHNGIEYAIMQGIAEIYSLLKLQGFSEDQILDFFTQANTGKTASYLVEITINILKTKDEDGSLLVDKVLNVAKAKGTGRWTTEAALELGVNSPTLAAAVFARISSARNQMFTLSESNFTPKSEHNPYPDTKLLLEKYLKTLEALYLVSYLQGLDLIAHANQEFNWNINLEEVIRIWQGGCIIRSEMLRDLYQIWTNPIDLTEQNWLLWFTSNSDYNASTPVINSASAYTKALVTANSTANLIQAQRDYFGAHTYRRTDKSGDFSGGWVR